MTTKKIQQTYNFNEIALGYVVSKDKSEFNMSKLVFKGHALSDHSIGLADLKVKAVLCVSTDI
jgi:hypothetical protein